LFSLIPNNNPFSNVSSTELEVFYSPHVEHTVKCTLKLLTNILEAETYHHLLQQRLQLGTTQGQFDPPPNLTTISLNSSFPRFIWWGGYLNFSSCFMKNVNIWTETIDMK
jgi:hypothetical protein